MKDGGMLDVRNSMKDDGMLINVFFMDSAPSRNGGRGVLKQQYHFDPQPWYFPLLHQLLAWEVAERLSQIFMLLSIVGINHIGTGPSYLRFWYFEGQNYHTNCRQNKEKPWEIRMNCRWVIFRFENVNLLTINNERQECGNIISDPGIMKNKTNLILIRS